MKIGQGVTHHGHLDSLREVQIELSMTNACVILVKLDMGVHLAVPSWKYGGNSFQALFGTNNVLGS
jgi:hypothetical protein